MGYVRRGDDVEREVKPLLEREKLWIPVAGGESIVIMGQDGMVRAGVAAAGFRAWWTTQGSGSAWREATFAP
jgi:hypothetical protein